MDTYYLPAPAANDVLAYHLVHRGYRRQRVFFRAADCRAYLTLLGRNARRFRLSILAFCLMSNHVHLLVCPRRSCSWLGFLRLAHGAYAGVVRCRREAASCAPLWSPSFFCRPLNYPGLWTAARYVEANPVLAGTARRAEDYDWSSAQAHVSGVDPRRLLDMRLWKRNFPGGFWSQELERWAAEHAALQSQPLFRKEPWRYCHMRP